MDLLKFDIHGIKCDNRLCDYMDDNIKFEPEKYLNMPCPKCGESLFTPQDYKTMKRFIRIAKVVNFVFGPFFKNNEKYEHVKIKMNGTGKIELDNKC